MNKEEYYNRVKKTRNKTMTDRTSKDEDYQILCQVNYLSKRYIETLENALDEIEKYIETKTEKRKSTFYGLPDYTSFNGNIEEILEIIKKAKGE